MENSNQLIVNSDNFTCPITNPELLSEILDNTLEQYVQDKMTLHILPNEDDKSDIFDDTLEKFPETSITALTTKSTEILNKYINYDSEDNIKKIPELISEIFGTTNEENKEIVLIVALLSSLLVNKIQQNKNKKNSEEELIELENLKIEALTETMFYRINFTCVIIFIMFLSIFLL